MVSWGRNIKLGVRGKYEKGERKKEENYIKKGEKDLKNASFWAVISKNFTAGIYIVHFDHFPLPPFLRFILFPRQFFFEFIAQRDAFLRSFSPFLM